MEKTKKYYWIKLKDTFMTSDAVDFLMSQKDGANYVVLYQMLCLKTANLDGRLERQLGEVIIPYDPEKIARDTKYFSKDTVIVALELYKKLGLVYVDDGGCLCIANFTNIVGGESESANRVRVHRSKKAALQCNKNVTLPLSLSLSLNSKSMSIPSLEEVKQYCISRRNSVDPEAFISFYESKGWMIGKNKMKSWQAAVRTWEKNRKDKQQGAVSCGITVYRERNYDE